MLLVDEPIAMLDPYHQFDVMRMLRGYAAGGTAPRLVVAVLHDLGLAARFCDRALLLNDGAVVGDGPPTSHVDLGSHSRALPCRAVHRKHDGESLIVPWRTLPRASEAD